MASLSNDGGGKRRIQFRGKDGKRKAIRLGKVPVKQARMIRSHVEQLVACQTDGSARPDATGQKRS